jgi:uncharacterized repeat protein (TIGR01451 family)
MHPRTIALAFAFFACGDACAISLPAGFRRTDPIVNRNQPTGVYFAHDGRVFVSEKSGQIWVYRNLLDSDPQLFADLSASVHDYWDRGLLGFALDPGFPEQPYIYVQYAYNGGLFDDIAPRWPEFDCADPTGENGGCVISGHISRLTVDGNSAGNELVLVEDWYQQYPSHSVGTLLFGPEGALYAGGGDGASFNFHDLGQSGNPTWPDQRSPPNEGGSLRSQGLEDEAAYADQVWLNGAIIRIDPETGAGLPDNPLGAETNTPNARRIIAYGLRNPFRFTFRPSTSEVWIGDVGENTWEEINRIVGFTKFGGVMQNFGWPCFEGRGHHDGFDVPICQRLYADGGGRTPVSDPWYAYNHNAGPDPGMGSDITGLAFYVGDLYPPQYFGALFFADNSRNVIFDIPYADANGDFIPDAPPDDGATPFYDGGTAAAVQLTTGPAGDIFLANLLSGRISRISYCDGCTNQAPSAAIALDAGSTADGPPRTITFTAANSIDPDAGDSLTYDWDLDGDGKFGDASGVTAFRFYGDARGYNIAVRVTDAAGASDVQRMGVSVTGSLGNADAGVTIFDRTDHVFPGDALQYTVLVDNRGDADIVGESVTSALSSQLTDISWTCVGFGGAQCVAGGSGDIEDLADLPVGTSVEYTIHAILPLDATGELTNTATVTPPPGYFDPNPLDNSASDIDTIIGDRIFASGFEPR